MSHAKKLFLEDDWFSRSISDDETAAPSPDQTAVFHSSALGLSFVLGLPLGLILLGLLKNF